MRHRQLRGLWKVMASQGSRVGWTVGSAQMGLGSYLQLLLQAPDGLIFPDRATLYVTAIEDRQYKDYKIHCELGLG